MKLSRIQHILIGASVLLLFTVAAAAMKSHKEEHHNGKELVGERIKTNGHHELHKKGKFTTSVDVKDGKISGVHVRHSKKGDIPVKKYKTNKNMSQAAGSIFLLSCSISIKTSIWA